MEKNTAFPLRHIILLENRSASSFPFEGKISECTVLRWLVTVHDFYSWLIWCLIQTILHFIFSTWKGWAAEGGENTTASVTAPSSKACSNHVNVDNKLSRGEVEVVMEKLGISWDPNGDKIQESLGTEEIAALFDDELSLEDAKEAFVVFDENSDGFIDANELEKIICTLGFAEVSEVECRRMIRAFDDNGDGRIDFSRFKTLLENSSW